MDTVAWTHRLSMLTKRRVLAMFHFLMRRQYILNIFYRLWSSFGVFDIYQVDCFYEEFHNAVCVFITCCAHACRILPYFLISEEASYLLLAERIFESIKNYFKKEKLSKCLLFNYFSSISSKVWNNTVSFSFPNFYPSQSMLCSKKLIPDIVSLD